MFFPQHFERKKDRSEVTGLNITSIQAQCSPCNYSVKHGNCVFIKLVIKLLRLIQHFDKKRHCVHSTKQKRSKKSYRYLYLILHGLKKGQRHTKPTKRTSTNVASLSFAKSLALTHRNKKWSDHLNTTRTLIETRSYTHSARAVFVVFDFRVYW